NAEHRRLRHLPPDGGLGPEAVGYPRRHSGLRVRRRPRRDNNAVYVQHSPDRFGGLREHIWLFGDALMKKLMILDGNSVVNRAFYGVRPLNAPDGTPTN